MSTEKPKKSAAAKEIAVKDKHQDIAIVATSPVETQTMELVKSAPAPAVRVEAGDDEYAQYAGAGHEEHRKDDDLIPIVRVLQTNSPECDDRTRNPRPEPGWLINTATSKVYPALAEANESGLLIIPVTYDTVVVRWIPQDDGGGFVGVYSPDDPKIKPLLEAKSMGKIILEKGTFDSFDKKTELSLTKNLYAIAIDEAAGDGSPVVIPCESTKLTPFKKWLNEIAPPMKKPKYPLFAYTTRLQTIKEERDKGKSYNFRFTNLTTAPNGPFAIRSTKDELFQLAATMWETLRKAKLEGKDTVDYGTQKAEPAAAKGDGPAADF